MGGDLLEKVSKEKILTLCANCGSVRIPIEKDRGDYWLNVKMYVDLCDKFKTIYPKHSHVNVCRHCEN